MSGNVCKSCGDAARYIDPDGGLCDQCHANAWDAAVRHIDKRIIEMARQGLTYGEIGRQVDRSKDYVKRVVKPVLGPRLTTEDERTRAAILAEREECAKIAEKFGWRYDGNPVPASRAEKIAAAIRARGTP